MPPSYLGIPSPLGLRKEEVGVTQRGPILLTSSWSYEGRKEGGSGFGHTGDHVTSILGDQTLGLGYVKGSLAHAEILTHSPANYAEHWCSLLKRSETPFARCHVAVDPTEYYKVSSSPRPTLRTQCCMQCPQSRQSMLRYLAEPVRIWVCVCLSAGMRVHVCSLECTGCQDHAAASSPHCLLLWLAS